MGVKSRDGRALLCAVAGGGRCVTFCSVRLAQTHGVAIRRGTFQWLPLKDSNLEQQSQNLLCYHYTKG